MKIFNSTDSKPTKKEPEPKVPGDLHKVLLVTKKVEALWDDLTPIARRDFISWIENAKQVDTRKSRIERVGPMLVSGKRRPCCYAVVPMNLYKALGTNAKAKATWKDLSPNERRDFVDWIDGAKNNEERELRIKKSCELLAQGKHHS
jgi:uncharacterized protein YdeI (YjbR/CyaY-like superfamily)